MLEKETIQLKELKTHIDEKFIIQIKIFNPEQRTLYAYKSPRRILYNDNTHVLTLLLHDQDIDPDKTICRQLNEPKYTTLEQCSETEIKIELPKIIKRLRSHIERKGNGPIAEQLQIVKATTVTIEIAHQDTPFYYDPKQDLTKQLQRWGNTIAKASFELT